MEGLLTDVSDTAKIRGDTLKLAPKMDMFKNIALKVGKTVQPLADQLGRKLTFEIPSGLPVLDVDGDLLAKVSYYLAHDEERQALARRAQAHVYAEHTYDRRAERLVALLESS